MKKLFLTLVAGILLLQLPAYANTTLPAPTGKAVSDFAGLLTTQEQEQLAQKLHKFRDSTTAQIAVVTIPVAWRGDLAIEEYANQLARQWELGEKGKDNGVLFLIVGTPSDKEGRGLRFEIGYGLEGVLPDALCKRIQREEVVPQLKEGKYYAAIDAGITAMMKAVGGELEPEPEASSGGDMLGKIGAYAILGLIFAIGLAMVAFIFFFIRGIFRAFWGGGSFGGSSWSSSSDSGSWSGSSDSSSSSDYSGGGGDFGGGGSSSDW